MAASVGFNVCYRRWPMSAAGREEPIEGLALSADCKEFRHRTRLARRIEARDSIVATGFVELPQSVGAVLRCQRSKYPLMAES